MDVLTLLDNEFSAFADGISQGRYAFWLGSGISLFRFPGLKKIVIKALEHLRTHVDPADEACPFKIGLNRAFAIADLSPAERGKIDLNVPVEDWPVVDFLRDRLSGKYSAFLNIDIDGQPIDYLAWVAVDVAGVYADEAVEPDAEHYAIAALVSEGIVTELPSANWDGLIEKAVNELSGGNGGLKVCVRSQDLQEPAQKATLIKFHGCAVRARDDETTYREYLVGAQGQIDGWETNPRTRSLAHYLVNVAITKPTLMLGLSAQDANIRKIFDVATASQDWPWPGELPAYVMAEEEVGEAQLALLRNVYREQFAGPHRGEIKKSAHLQAFAKPLLAALLLWVLAAKLQRAARLGAFELSSELGEWINEGIKLLRDQVAAANTADHLAFVKALIFGGSRTKRLALAGANSAEVARYEPLTHLHLGQMNQDAETETNGLAQVAVMVAALANGAAAGDWALKPDASGTDRGGTMQLVKGTRTDRVFLLANSDAELSLFDSAALDDEDEDALLIHAQPIRERLTRSPTRAPGRTGAVGPRRVSIASLLEDDIRPFELLRRFKLEAGL